MWALERDVVLYEDVLLGVKRGLVPGLWFLPLPLWLVLRIKIVVEVGLGVESWLLRVMRG